jgi:hypothetical protein
LIACAGFIVEACVVTTDFEFAAKEYQVGLLGSSSSSTIWYRRLPPNFYAYGSGSCVLTTDFVIIAGDSQFGTEEFPVLEIVNQLCQCKLCNYV